MPYSTFLSNALLNHLTGVASYAPGTLYAGVSSTQPQLDGTNVTEPTTGSYGRVAVASWSPATSAMTSTAQTVLFPTATGDWLLQIPLTYVVIFDAAVNGHLLAFGILSSPTGILTGDTLFVPAGDLTIIQS